MKQFTFSAQVANNLLTVLQGYSKTIRLLLVMFLTLTASTAWGATDVILWNGSSPSYQASTTEKTSTDGAIKWVNSAGNTYSNPTRIYSGNTLTISVANTATTKITKIVAVCTTDAYASAFGGTSVDVTGGGTANRSVSSSTTTITITGKATSVAMKMSAQSRVSKLTVTYETAAATKYTVTLNAGPGTCAASVTEASAGDGVTLPTPTLDCGDWEFAGWATSAVATETSSKPATLLTGTYKPTSNITLYAVYQRTVTTSGGGGGSTEVTFNFGYTDWGKAASFSGTTYDTVEQNDNGVSVTYTRNDGSLYANMTSLRLYKTNTLTFDAGSNTITSITFTGNIGQSDITTDAGTCTNSTNTLSWAGSSTSVTFTRPSNASSYATLTSATLTIIGGGSTTYYHSTPDCGSTASTYTLTLDSDLSCVTDGSATVELNATELTNFTPATRDGFTCSGYWSAPSGGVKVLNADGTFAATSVQDYITDGKWTNEGNVTLTPRWECSNTMTLSVGTQSGGTYSLSKTSLETCDCTDNKRQVTITATPNSGYSVTDISYSGNGTATKVSGPTVNGENTEWVYQFSQGDKETGKFTVTFTVIPTYTVTWMVNGEVYETTQVTEGSKPTFPTTPSSCDATSTTFYGWATATWDGKLDDINGKTIYTSANEMLAVNGAVTYHAVFATQDGATETEWVKKEIGEIKESDVVVITMTNGETTWAMTNANGTSNPPAASTLTVDGNKLSSTIADAVKWNISNNDGNLTIYPNGTTANWLYCTSTSNGVRVGTNENKIFTIDATYGYLKHTGTNRYVGVYNNQDWRCYTSMHDNIKGQTLGFYVKSVVGGSYSGYVTHCEVCTVTELTLTPSASEVNLGEAGNAVVTFTPTGGNGGTVSYVASPSTGVTWNNNEATFTKAGTYTITASQVMNEDKCPTEATTTVVVTATPVLYFREGPADPIVFVGVECGGNKTTANKQSVSLQGYNLTDSVNVTVEGDYKIAKTAGESIVNYKTTLTLDKTGAGKIYLDYDDVYIIATPPAGKTEPTTGTLTFTTEGGNTLTVNLSTPTITCPQYTLTFNDRGTKATEQYYVGEVVDEPEEPTGVCTEPINYVFDGWATATVTEGSTTYEKVSFGSYTMPKQNTTLYAVYRYVEEGSGDSGELEKVTDIAQVTTDATYAIISFDEAYYLPNTQATSNPSTGSIAKEDGVITVVDAMKWNVSIAGDKFVFTSVADANNILWGAVANDGIRINETSAKQNPTKEWSLETVNDYGLVLFHTADNAAHKYLSTYGVADWRNYYSTNLNATNRAANLYKLSTGTTYYTTSPVCGPHLAITDGKDIYVTGGNAGGTRDLVIAQQKVSYKATRLQTSNGLDDGTAPDVKVATNGITVGGVVTQDVKVTIDQTKEQQTDGTYTITGTITVQYQPSANNKQEDIQVQLAVDYNAEARDNFIVHARSLPSEFVIVAKSGDKWYALNGDMSSSKAHPANGQVTLDNVANPTKATYAPCNTIYTFDGLPNTGDRTYVRFQGTDGAWLWASTGDNTGIQNNTLAQNPAGDANPYNWKLTTTDNVTYQFSNANNNRNLRLSGGNFGMYASGVQDIHILPVEAKCIYNYAPANLKVSVLKGTYATLTWDAVQGATKYQYSTDATNWTDAGATPTLTINGLTETTAYTYYVRAYHEDADITQECIDYATVSFTTAACDDVPTNITYSADLNSITVSWTAAASNAIVKLYSDEEGTVEVKNSGSTTLNPYTFEELNKNTTYYLQVFASGICASEIVEVSTQDVELNIVEWQPNGIVVDINTNEKVKVTLENEVSYGSGTGTVAEDLFFSKYFEGSGSLKMLAIYNGTGKDVDLSEYRIDRGSNGDATNVSKTYDLSQLGIIKQGQEIIFYSWPLTSEYSYSCSQSYLNNVATKSGQEDNPRWILCGNDPTGKATPIYGDAMNFSGDDPLLLRKNEVLIDVIGVSTKTTGPTEKTLCTGRSEEAWSADGVTNMDYGKTEEDFEDGEIPHGVNVDDETITAYTARVIMFRKNTVVSGDDAVTKNIDNFVTFADEWEARQVCMSGDDGDLTCAAYQELGKFDYSEYYTKYVSMGDEREFDTNNRNADGTLTVPITDLFKQSCRNIKITLKDATDNVLKEQPYKVPIIITSDQTTAGDAFLALQENLATVEIDGSGNPTGNKINLTLEEVKEICKTCDVVIRDNATLTKVETGTDNDHPQVNNVYIYEGASLVVPDGNYTYNVNGLSLRRREDQVPSLSVQGGEELKVNAESIYLDLRVNAENWHWFTLPYDCDIADVTWVDGTPAEYGVDWFLSTYDGEKRAATQSGGCWAEFHGETIKAGVGYIVGIKGDITKPKYTFELRFPMSTEVLANELTDKTVPVNAWGVENDMLDNHRGWNLVGNPYLDYYQKNYLNSFGGLRLGGKYILNDDNYWVDSGEWDGQPDGNLPYVVEPINGGWSAYNQVLVSSIDLLPFTAYFVQVGERTKGHANGERKDVLFYGDNRGRASIARRAPSCVSEQEEPVIVGVNLTNSKGESDMTSLVIDDKYTDEYEMNADFFKWFGDYYRYYTRPVVYTIGADKQQRAFNAINEEQAAKPVSMGTYTAQNGEYTFSLDRRSDLTRVKEVWLHDATESAYINLMQEDYSFSTGKSDGTGRFTLAVTLHPKSPTDITDGMNGQVYVTSQQRMLYVNNLPQQARVWVYDAVGKLLVNESTNVYQRAYHVGQAGVYFVRVESQNGCETLQAVVE